MGTERSPRSQQTSMKTQIFTVDPGRMPQEIILAARDILAQGGIMVFPTDTVYGLGCDSRSRAAARRIYDLKRRLPSKPSPILVADLDMVRGLALELPPCFEILAAKFWPGPLTLVLRVRNEFPPEILGPHQTLGMRLPDVPWIRELAGGLGAPLLATSANISGEREITDAAEVSAAFRDKVDLIIDGGPSAGAVPSTVVDLTSGEPRILRQGSVSGQRILESLAGQKC